MKKYIFILTVLNMAYTVSYSQEKAMLKDSLYSFVNNTSTQKTANSQDILSNVFKASIANLFGKSKSLEYNFTLYSIDSLLNTNARVVTEKYYSKQRTLRNIQINLSAKLDSNTNKVSNLSLGATIAILNKRDITFGDFSIINSKFEAFEKLRKKLNLEACKGKDSLIVVIQKSWEKYDTTHNYKDLDPSIKAALAKRSAVDKALIQSDEPHIAYQNLVSVYARKPLLTISPNYSYNSLSNQSAFSIKASFLDGIGNAINKTPWEFQANASFSIEGDSTIAEPNYNNKPFTVSAGVNKVLRQDSNKASTLELKGFFQYNDQFGSVPSENNMGKVTFNTTLRINVYKSIWLPLTLSYNVKNSNILGFLSLTADIDK